MTFKNECNCIVDEELLSKAVDDYCRRNNVYCNNEHRIVLHNNYPTIVISRKHLYVHDLLRMNLFHTRKGYVVHHKDFNKLNNTADNLMYISHSKHSHIHSVENWKRFREENIKFEKQNIRKDISDSEIKEMINDGLSVKEIAELLQCHHNTIYNRLRKKEGEEI